MDVFGLKDSAFKVTFVCRTFLRPINLQLFDRRRFVPERLKKRKSKRLPIKGSLYQVRDSLFNFDSVQVFVISVAGIEKRQV